MLLLTNGLLGEVQTLVLKAGFGLLLSAALTTPPPPFPGLPLKGIIAAQQKSTEAGLLGYSMRLAGLSPSWCMASGTQSVKALFKADSSHQVETRFIIQDSKELQLTGLEPALSTL